MIDMLDIEASVKNLKLDSFELKNADAQMLYNEKQYNQALAVYCDIVEEVNLKNQCCGASYLITIYSSRCVCYMMLSRYEDALEDAKNCLKLDPKHIQAIRLLVKCSLMIGNLHETENAIDKLEQIEPSKQSISTEVNDTLSLKKFLLEYEGALSQRNYEKALSFINDCCEISPFSVRFKVTKAETLTFLRRYAEAEKIVNDVLNTHKQNIDAIYIKGVCLFDQNTDQALNIFEQVLFLASNQTKTWKIYKKEKLIQCLREAASAAFKAQKYQDAKTIYNKLLLFDPESHIVTSKIHYNLAVIAAKLNNLRECIGECRNALMLNNNYLKAILMKAACYMELEEYKQAILDYEKVYELDKSEDSERLLNEAKVAFDDFKTQSQEKDRNSQKGNNQNDTSSNSKKKNDDPPKSKEKEQPKEKEKEVKKDYYNILGVDKTATLDDIKKAYHRKAKAYHPDKHPDASEEEIKDLEKKFKEIGKAYSILSDVKNRSRYDNGQEVFNCESNFSEDEERTNDHDSSKREFRSAKKRTNRKGYRKSSFSGNTQAKFQFDSSKQSDHTQDSKKKENICWYHFVFGDRCWKCWPVKCMKSRNYMKENPIIEFELLD